MRRLIIALLLALMLPGQGWADVAWVSNIDNNAGAVTTLTLANVVGSGGNAVIACFTWRKSASQVMTGVTYGGAAMTQISSEVSIGGGALACWRYWSPSGTADVVGTWNAAPGSVQGTALVFSGVDVAGTPLGTVDTDICASIPCTAITSSVSLGSGGMGVDVIFVRGSASRASIATTGGNTQRSTRDAASSLYHRTSTEAVGGDGTMSWSWTTGDNAGQMAIPVNAAPATEQTFGFRLRLTQ